MNTWRYTRLVTIRSKEIYFVSLRIISNNTKKVEVVA